MLTRCPSSARPLSVWGAPIQHLIKRAASTTVAVAVAVAITPTLQSNTVKRSPTSFKYSHAHAHASRAISTSTPASTGSTSQYYTSTVGAPQTTDFRIHFHNNKTNNNNNNNNNPNISPWHHIPLYVSEQTIGTQQDGNNKQQLLHYINEIPKGTRAKMEIATTEAYTPIKQDVKKGQLRFFQYGDIPFNYGALPQTWEDPNVCHPLTHNKGDNDPVDVVEISGIPLAQGAVQQVKILGILALLDEGETDWKLIAISNSSPLFQQLNNISDVDRLLPGTTNTIREWFRMYKTADGKSPNEFAFAEQFLDSKFAAEIINETHAAWKSLCEGSIPTNGLWIPTTQKQR